MIGFELQTFDIEATALPTEPQPLPRCRFGYFSDLFVFDQKTASHLSESLRRVNFTSHFEFFPFA